MTSKNKYLISTIILGITPIILAVAIIKPSVSGIMENKAEIQKQHQKFRELLDRGQGIQKTKNNFELVDAAMESINNVFLKTGQELDFITTLEQVAKKNDVRQVIVFDNKTGQTIGDITHTPVELRSTGTHENLMSYIGDLEALNFYINFDSINITNNCGAKVSSPHQIDGDDETKPTHELNMQLQGVTYWK